LDRPDVERLKIWRQKVNVGEGWASVVREEKIFQGPQSQGVSLYVRFLYVALVLFKLEIEGSQLL
jgi:hypothetical protein